MNTLQQKKRQPERSPQQLKFDLADDLLEGAEEIAAFLNKPLSTTYYWLARGYVPAEKAGTKYIGSKRRITRHFLGGDAAIEARNSNND